MYLLFAEASSEMVSVKEAIINKGKHWENYKLHKNWTENQWQQILWRDDSLLNHHHSWALLWFRAAFHRVVLGMMSKLIELCVQ